ncbi:S9 family peptidase [Massilia sp. IC2-278]|uniref:S9 family peptidase n=1 Tax=Massilia sp. IC2-278 TaxID=2887200 RepID=UPI001E5CE8E5|nr:prolyl oligopeptidase family serine peptidase [Massilia sp. IC2-278]MCC2959150.1 S9 family peptidase [Massilia sp. IC2-278]
MRLFQKAVRVSLLAACIAATLSPAQAAAPAPTGKAAQKAQKQPKRYTIEQFMATTSVNGASFSRDEKQVLFNSNASGIFNAYVLPVGGGTPRALTSSTTDSTYAVGFFYNDDRILFTRDQGGNEQNHLYVRELDGAERDLTPGAKLKAAFAGWQPDGKAFYVSTNERDPKYFDLYRYDAKTYARTLVYQNETGRTVSAISRDGRYLALDKPNTTADSDVYLYDVQTRETKHISQHQGTASYSAQDFDPDSKRLLFATNDGGEFTRIRAYDLATGAVTDVEQADWDIAGTGYSRNGRHRISYVNEDGSIRMRVADGATGKPVALPKTGGGEMRGAVFSDSGNLVAFYVNGDRSPNNLYVHDFRSNKTTQLTRSLSPEIDPNDLVEAEVVRFTSFDGTVIPSIFYKPKGASNANKVPAVVYVHGGPGGQTMRGYNAQIQYLVNHGYAVLGINNRGSSGYGKTFFTADDRKHGQEPLWDCVEAKTWLASLGWVDPGRIGIMGGSYGGYMTLAALAFRPEAFKVGIDIFGVSNWIRTLESIPPYWESQRKALYDEIGDPVKDKAFLTATSPLFHAASIRKPLMVIQGANDPRVIKPESDEIVEAVRKNGVEVEYVVFADEGHGFSKKKNQAEASAKILAFLDKHLKK